MQEFYLTWRQWKTLETLWKTNPQERRAYYKSKAKSSKSGVIISTDDDSLIRLLTKVISKP